MLCKNKSCFVLVTYQKVTMELHVKVNNWLLDWIQRRLRNIRWVHAHTSNTTLMCVCVATCKLLNYKL